MKDRIRGQVFHVIDGRTFLLKVLEQRESNEYGYNVVEQVRFAPTDDPSQTTDSEFSRRKLEFRIKGQLIDCVVCGCETDALIARVAILGDSLY